MIALDRDAKNPWDYNNVGVRLPIALLLCGRIEEALNWIKDQGGREPEFLYPAFAYYRDQYLPSILALLKPKLD